MKISTPTDPSAVDLDAIDLMDPQLYASGDPHPLWHALRVREPVRWQSTGPDLGFWSVTRLPDVDRVLRDHTLFTSQRGTLLSILGKDDPASGRQMAATDPPNHTRMREPVQRALAVRNINRHQDRIRREVRGLFEPAFAGEEFDFAAAMMSLPMVVIGVIMDLPPADWPHLTQLTTASIAENDPEYQLPGGPEATLTAAHRELFAYFQDIVTKRRRAIGDDLISTLLTMEVSGRPLSLGEILSNCYSLILGANVTTPCVPNAAIAHLAGTATLADWFAHPELVMSGVEEALRWSSPAIHFMRYALTDVPMGDRTIRAGEAVVAWLASANRDEQEFPDPFTFDIRRRPNRHIAFGAGAHYCVGHTVARNSLRILFEELITGFEEIDLVTQPEHLCSNFVAGIKHMRVSARPRPEAVTRFLADSRGRVVA